MEEPEEVNLMEVFKFVAAEMHNLRESIDRLTVELSTLKAEPIMQVGTLIYDYVEEMKSLKELLKQYVEVAVYGEVKP